MKRFFRILVPVFVLILLVAGGVRLIKRRRAALRKLPPPQAAPLPLEAARVQVGPFEVTEHYLGEIRPFLSARLSSRLSGYLLEVRKYEGDPVRKSEVLARIDDHELQARIQSLERQVAAAEAEFLARKHTFERDRVLYQNRAISQEAFENSRAAFKKAEATLHTLRAELASARADLTYTLIRAPFSGVITRRLKEPGDLVTPGTPILEMEAPEKGYRIFVSVPQARAAALRAGTRAYLREDRQRLPVKVFRVHPAVGAGELATVEIRVAKRPFGLPSGARVGVDLVVKDLPRAAIVPLKSLLENVNRAYVFRLRPEKGALAQVEVVPVRVLGRSGERVAVSGALSQGDLVAVAEESTLLRLHPGEVVRVVP
ncbi:efflux RND transporter periplasmic adaptor subunit [Thermosulfurimonas marina]|uniref:Efflux RND transporter periplasmic adaptor subunit n=1 Tax=Thermosulfurimonas marina TaxID=2047767 RepID=A0A6H1WTK3_9BACT|nr:efflux RND transporter periplasmic adaptor subunit [Thermosulfurimonas marina]QJA06522.1 efflux RND transporter periplasmic adaptor subunit [Thermosulfurimonas marina]